MKSAAIFLVGVVGSALPLLAQTESPSTVVQDITIPHSDSQYKATRGYIEDTPVPGYQHASPAAFEAFRDLKYGVRIHWGIYSILEETHASWPFLKMSYAKKEAYNELYKTWNPTGFDAEQWMQLFQDCEMKMFHC